jgi:hypothetical protein
MNVELLTEIKDELFWADEETIAGVEALKPHEYEVFNYLYMACDTCITHTLDIYEKEFYRFYTNCFSMGDVAREVIQNNHFDLVEHPLYEYFDFDAYGRHLESCGNFTKFESGVYVEVYY